MPQRPSVRGRCEGGAARAVSRAPAGLRAARRTVRLRGACGVSARRQLTVDIRQRGMFGARRVQVIADLTLGGLVDALARALEAPVARCTFRMATLTRTTGRVEAHLAHPSGEEALIALSPAIVLPRRAR